MDNKEYLDIGSIIDRDMGSGISSGTGPSPNPQAPNIPIPQHMYQLIGIKSQPTIQIKKIASNNDITIVYEQAETNDLDEPINITLCSYLFADINICHDKYKMLGFKIYNETTNKLKEINLVWVPEYTHSLLDLVKQNNLNGSFNIELIENNHTHIVKKFDKYIDDAHFIYLLSELII